MKTKILLGILMMLLCSSLTGFAATTGVAETPQDYYYQVIFDDVLQTSGLSVEWSDWITKMILFYSNQNQVNPLLVAANFKQESRYNPSACSVTGAVGISQLMPQTAANLGVNPYDPAQNIEGGVRYLAYLLRSFSNSGEWAGTYAIAAYNAGPQAVKDYGGVPPYNETMAHVQAVARNMNSFIVSINNLGG